MKDRRRLLVLDDHAGLRRALERVFSRYEVTSCGSVAEARRLLLAQRFDAVVSDVDLPDGNGVDLFEDIARAHPEQAKRYVFLSGATDAPKVRARLERTGAPYFGKPFSAPALIDLVMTLVAGDPAVPDSAPRV